MKMPGPGEFALDGLEMTQVVQNMAHEVPLFADKQTVVRAYVSVNADAPVAVSGVLTGRRVWPPGSSMTRASDNTVKIDPAQNGQLRPKRENIDASLNFRLPASWDDAGVYAFTLAQVRDAATGAGKVCADCATGARAVLYRHAAPLRLRTIGLRYQLGTPPVTYAPQAIDFNLTRSWLGRAYPVANVIWSQRTVDVNTPWNNSCNSANTQLSAIRVNDVNGGVDARTHYFGLVSDGGQFMRGCAAGIPGTASPGTVASGPTGPGNWGWDFDGSYGDWYTGHELGHTLGRFHIGSGCGESSDAANYPFPSGQLSDANGAFVGLDVGDAAQGINMRALPGPTWHDVMSYCNNQWLSSYTYGHMNTRLVAEDALAPGAPAPESGVVPAAAGSSNLAMGPAIEVQPSLASPPAATVGAQTPAPTTRAYDAPLPEGTPAQAAPLPPEPAYPEGFTLPEPALSAPPPVERGTPPTPSVPEAERLMTESAAPQPLMLNEEMVSGDFLSIIASVNLTQNSGHIQYVTRVSTAVMPKSVPNDRARIVLYGQDGAVLGDYAVPVKQDTDVPPGEDVMAVVDGLIPFVEGVTKVELLLSGKVVDQRAVSKAAPTVERLDVPGPTVTRLMGAPTGAAAEPFTLSWQASDADADQLTYIVLISGDGGKTWETMAVGLTQTQLEVFPEDIADMKSVTFRVIASDGFNSTEVTSQTVQP